MNLDDQTRNIANIVALAVGSTIVITASFIGVLALLEGEFSTVDDRFPWYLVSTSLIFLSLIFLLNREDEGGWKILSIAAVVSLIGFIVVVLSVEGIEYAVTNPGGVFVNKVILYFLAAGMFGTGIGYWGINYWREPTRTNN